MFTVALSGETDAQTCAGEVMHFRETFGTGSIAPLAPGRTNYTYKGTGSLADGDYRLSNTTQGRPEWYNVPDHTGNTDGRMMITNASYTPGEFYRDTVFGLSATHTYSVYFYVMNINTPGTCAPNPILPQLELEVESYNADGSFTHLSTIVSNALPQTNPATWVRVAGTYYLPVGVTAIRYRIINHSTGGCGNDLAIDDITFSQCQPQILPVTSLALKGKKENANVQLNWVAKESYSSFDIEKSENGTLWEFVKNVKAETPNQYSTSDVETAKNIQYRISAITPAGRRHYSNVISIKEPVRTAAISAYPNPFQGKLNVQMVSADDKPGAQVRLFDMKGQVVSARQWNISRGDNNFTFDEPGLTPGVYLVSISDRSGAILAHQRIVRR